MTTTKPPENAVIEEAYLGNGDRTHGILSISLRVSYGVCAQGVLIPITQLPVLFDVLEVDNWDDVVGQYCRIVGTYSEIRAIGHILKNKWLKPYADGIYYDFEQE